MAITCVASIVAIHGLNGDREATWTATTDDGDKLWLRDFLPNNIENASILTYGYDAYAHGRDLFCQQTLNGHARDFVAKLSLYRKSRKGVNSTVCNHAL
jgi:hypothetical protein